MTDEALAAAADAAPMPEINTPAPVEAHDAPEPVQKAEPTARGAIDRAFAALEQRDKQPDQAADKPAEATDDRPRNPDGTFAAKDGQPAPVEAKPEAPKPAKVETEATSPASQPRPHSRIFWQIWAMAETLPPAQQAATAAASPNSPFHRFWTLQSRPSPTPTPLR